MDYKEIKKLVLQKVDIKTVVDHYLGSGKQVGKQFFYRSPFKEGFDRTPSFAVLPSKQIFKCFSTNKGGNVIKFVEEMEKVNSIKAVEIIIKNFLPEYAFLIKRFKKEDYLKYIDYMYFFAKKAHEILLSSKNGLSYLEKRGIKNNIIKKMMLGYLNSYDDFIRINEEASKDGIDTSFSKFISVYKYITFYKNNIISFPLFNSDNEVIGIDFRILGKEKYNIRYMTQMNNQFYNLNNFLYGENLLREDQKEIFIVEGHFDMLVLAQEGLPVVALRGSGYRKKLDFLCRKKIVYLFLDNDESGNKSAIETGLELINNNLVFRVNPKPFKDPNEIAQQIGINIESIKRKMSTFFIDFMFEHYKNDVDNCFVKIKKSIKNKQDSENMKEYIDFLNDYTDNYYKGEQKENIVKLIEMKQYFLEGKFSKDSKEYDDFDKKVVAFILKQYSDNSEESKKDLIKVLAIYKPNNKNLFAELFFCIYNNSETREITRILAENNFDFDDEEDVAIEDILEYIEEKRENTFEKIISDN